MAMKLGSGTISSLYLGNTEITKAYLGNTEIYSSTEELWTPAEITTTLWLDASDTDSISDSGGSVSQWNDKSGNSYHATQALSARQPTTNSVTQNSLNVIDFDGTEELELAAGLLAITQSNYYVFIVAKTDGTGVQERLIAFANSGTKATLLITSSNNAVFFNRTSFGSLSTSVTDRTAYNIYQGYRNGTAQGVRINGGTEATNSNGEDVATVIANLGSYPTLSDPLDGKIAEVLIVPSTIDTATREIIEGYLAHKWGIESSLPIGHTYKSSAPTV